MGRDVLVDVIAVRQVVVHPGQAAAEMSAGSPPASGALDQALAVATSRGGNLVLTEPPQACFRQPPIAPDADSYYGRDEFARGFALRLSAFDEPRIVPQEATEAGDRVIVSGRGKTSGIETKAEFFHAWRLGDGKPHRCFVRSTRSEALEAVGLTG
jgi:hypothetical protein